jgi:putative hydrolase of the HAD superfamily
LYNFFEPYCIYLSAASKIRKPSPDIFIEVCKEMKIKPNEMVYVGDTISRDVIGAKNAKLRACIRIGKTPEGDKKFENTKYDTKYKINN